jgi:hypothetical protein
MLETGDNSALYFSFAYPSLDDSVFLTSDGVTEAPGQATGPATVGGTKRKSPRAMVEDIKIMREQSVREKNLSFSKLLDYTNKMQMRKRYGEVLDQQEDLEERLEKLEDRLLQQMPNDEYTKRRVDLLHKKNYMLIEEEQKLKAALDTMTNNE